MTNDIKLGLKVIRYGLNLKGCAFVSVLFLIMGIIFDFITPSAPINGLYMGMGAMMITQTICSASVSTMVQASSLKRRLQTTVPTIMGGLLAILGNTLSILVKFLGMKVLGNSVSEVSNGIVITAVLMVIMVLYMSGAMKAFWPATIGFFISYFWFYRFSFDMSFVTNENPSALPIEISVLVSYMMIIVSVLLMYIIFTVTYKRDFSKQNFEVQLKRAK